MKQSVKLTIAMTVIFILIGVVVYLMMNKQPVAKVPKPYPELVPMPSTVRTRGDAQSVRTHGDSYTLHGCASSQGTRISSASCEEI
jgi:hypothetical protein